MKYKMPFTDRDFSLVNETKTDGGKNPKNTKKDELIKELKGLNDAIEVTRMNIEK